MSDVNLTSKIQQAQTQDSMEHMTQMAEHMKQIGERMEKMGKKMQQKGMQMESKGSTTGQDKSAMGMGMHKEMGMKKGPMGADAADKEMSKMGMDMDKMEKDMPMDMNDM